MLYVVATPIGNLADISYRAIDVLASVDYILAEDTRHTKKLLQNYQITTKMMAFHEHNENAKTDGIIQNLQKGITYALVSDAGTPLINDPGYVLILAAKKHNITVSPIPGASALISALSASGIACDNFTFIGFLATKAGQRQKQLQQLVYKSETIIFYESPKRIMATLLAIQNIFGDSRVVCLAKELTKKFENIQTMPIAELVLWLSSDKQLQQGEFVIIITAIKETKNSMIQQKLAKILPILLTQTNNATAAKIAAKLTGATKKLCYDYIENILKV